MSEGCLGFWGARFSLPSDLGDAIPKPHARSNAALMIPKQVTTEPKMPPRTFPADSPSPFKTLLYLNETWDGDIPL